MANTQRDAPRTGRRNTQARAAALRAEQRRREARRRMLIAGGSVLAVLVVIAALVGLKLATGSKKTAAPATTNAASAVLGQVTSMLASVAAQVGRGAAKPLPTPISGPALTANGKPKIVYIGAEYCPYCAAERWPVVVALSRFGTWQNLGATSSASNDVYPNTATFSFHGARFSSPYVAFEGVETQDRQRAPLDSLTTQQQQLVDRYKPGGIPFIDFANRYEIAGATYDPGLLQGKTVPEIASALRDPNSKLAKGILGSANAITAAICNVTGNKPANVCATPTISALQRQLGG